MRIRKGLSVSFQRPLNPWRQLPDGKWTTDEDENLRWRIYVYNPDGTIHWRSAHNWSKNDVIDIVKGIPLLKGQKIRCYSRKNFNNRCVNESKS